MSRFFPQSDFAEDQPSSKTILTTHVLHRGLQSGALIGSITGAVRSFRVTTAPASPTESQALKTAALPKISTASTATRLPTASIQKNVTARTLAGAGTGSVVGAALAAIALVGRMYGREDIEWRDRSWRLLQNPGQVEVDDWSVVGTATGALGTSMIKTASTITPWKRIIGGAGLGNLVGVAGYMVWRHGVNRGEF